MLDEDEYAEARRLYGEAFKGTGSPSIRLGMFKPLLDFYRRVTGWDETNPDAIMHHRIAQYGPPCEHCGKPYRTPEASYCAACGHERVPG